MRKFTYAKLSECLYPSVISLLRAVYDCRDSLIRKGISDHTALTLSILQHSLGNQRFMSREFYLKTSINNQVDKHFKYEHCRILLVVEFLDRVECSPLALVMLEKVF